ncbi:hypothetical protein [Dokdonella soli]|uniref:DUF3829 domain-containing protein n=1 Tax=Dokdonella soli TaxID=529810 RepID=A0ABN1IGM1_9GAMM
MFKPIVRTALAASLLVFVAGCEQKPADSGAAVAPAVASAPDAAIRKSIDLLKQGDIAGLMQNSMPPAEFEKAKADWTKDTHDKPITDEDRQKFAETMGKLTAPDAEQKLFAEIEPQLKQFDAQYQQQIPMYVAMGSSWLQGMVQQNKDMSEDSKQQAVAAINALGTWVQKTHFTDPDSVKKVLAIASKSARDINLKTLDEARALNFDQAMQKARVAFLGFKDALGVYGFSLDQTLDSVKPEVVSNDGKTAKVKVSYALLGTPLTTETEMVNVDGRWYGKDAIEKLSQKKAEEAAAAQQKSADTAAAPASQN